MAPARPTRRDPSGSLPVPGRLSYAVARAEHAIRTSLDAELAPLGLSITQYSVLYLLAERPGSSGSELAARTLVTQQAVAHLLGRLERAGRVRRAGPPQGRRVPFEITAAGRAVLYEADARVVHLEHELRAGLTIADQHRLLDLVARCTDLVAPPDRSAGAHPDRRT